MSLALPTLVLGIITALSHHSVVLPKSITALVTAILTAVSLSSEQLLDSVAICFTVRHSVDRPWKAVGLTESLTPSINHSFRLTAVYGASLISDGAN
jgi:hypothetical protein